LRAWPPTRSRSPAERRRSTSSTSRDSRTRPPRAFANDPGGATAYGTAIGYAPLRAWIAEQHGVEPANVVVTNGSMQADAFLFDELVSPATRSSSSARPTTARCSPAPAPGRHPHGRARARRHRRRRRGGADRGGGAPKLAHIIPNFQNPAGYTLSGPKREALVGLAREHGFTIFEDDPYVSIRFAGDPLPTMLSLDRDDTVVYASSFSKTVCPGIRVGYLVGPAGAHRPRRQARDEHVHQPQHGGPGDRPRVLPERRSASARSRRCAPTSRRGRRARRALERDLPDARFVAPEGGYFMWVELPEGTDVDKLFAAAGERGRDLRQGLGLPARGRGNTLRLAYSGVTPEQIDAGIGRLAEAYKSLSGAPAAA
jgi:DNA-binding transcriptional MocR family regulator